MHSALFLSRKQIPGSDEWRSASQGGAPAPASGDAAGAGQAAGGEAPGDPKPTGFKAAREAARRADAGNRAAWNTLFMRPDTVAAAVAAHYGVSKSELLDRDAEGALADRLHSLLACLPKQCYIAL